MLGRSHLGLAHAVEALELLEPDLRAHVLQQAVVLLAQAAAAVAQALRLEPRLT